MLQGFKAPKNNKDYEWTNHAVRKMQYYRLGESRVKRVVRYPKRKEAGIAEGTTAVMTPSKILKGYKNKWKEEIWVMYIEVGSSSARSSGGGLEKKIGHTSGRKRIISAWRYPGMSKKGSDIPIPEDIRLELEGIVKN